jgi:hypothetical protein
MAPRPTAAITGSPVAGICGSNRAAQSAGVGGMLSRLPFASVTAVRTFAPMSFEVLSACTASTPVPSSSLSVGHRKAYGRSKSRMSSTAEAPLGR